ncbi:ribosome small subunit-dependent GTPase A [Acetilactobacillus jinshanensis]|uniref:Small ribosomal subunit biogenesis GTPase RsgA n=1 Tax=Acetilactobacillus jinshanensis TaxID=1720083 RepID=A0A4P6ZLJ4_9LACO|nr:ribosome small subunit-dependent GTPase A [Acetilactobacillus jinshanensis]QBP18624.1 ribosome small subunit-dependent GTPase A [Acetilactobacillus jinshanensis]URL61500.1 ribosome small subunit-dependent GTPase A [uncultured bacterium]
MPVGKIYQSLGGFYDIASHGHMYRTRARGNFRAKRIKPIVGDVVDFKSGYVLSVHRRINRLSRPPLANLTQAIIVTSTQEPRFSAGLLDRQLVALGVQHIKPLIYFSKLDLLDPEQQAHYLKIAKYYHDIGYDVFAPKKAFCPTTLDLLKNHLTGQETVVMGQTGVGKSSLLNHLKPGLNLKTGQVSKALHRGKHTTRRVHLIIMNHGLIADTPGFSSYEILNVDIYHLKNYFPEFVKNSSRCKFRECLHVNEPKCQIKQMVKDGKIMKSRYDTYLHLFTLIKNRKPIYHKKH